MKIENQVCTLEQSVRLKELGVKQVSIFVYDGDKLIFNGYKDIHPINLQFLVSAFTVAELGEMLPIKPFEVHGVLVSWISYSNDGDGWDCVYYNQSKTMTQRLHADTEAEARAAMLIHLLETGTIKP